MTDCLMTVDMTSVFVAFFAIAAFAMVARHYRRDATAHMEHKLIRREDLLKRAADELAFEADSMEMCDRRQEIDDFIAEIQHALES